MNRDRDRLVDLIGSAVVVALGAVALWLALALTP